MKIAKTTIATIITASFALNAFAIAPSGPANSANTCPFRDRDDESKCTRPIIKAMEKDEKQDAKGQAKLDRAWAQLVKAGVVSGPNPYTYEGSPADMRQDQKLAEKLDKQLEKHGCGPVSPFS